MAVNKPGRNVYRLLPSGAEVKERVELYLFCVGRGSSVRIETCYGLDGPGIETRWAGIFYICPHRPWGPLRLLYNGYRVSFPGVKRPGRGVNHPHPSSAEVKERVELHFWEQKCSSTPFRFTAWTGTRVPLPLP